MSIFKRALINIGSNKGKTLLLLVVFFTSMFAITMNNIVNETYTKLLEEAFPDGDVPVYLTPSAMSQRSVNRDDIKNITPEMYEEIAKLETVSRMEKSMGTHTENLDYKLADGSNYNMASISFEDELKSFTEDTGHKVDYDANLYATGERPIIVNDEFLESNDLEVGEKMTLNFSNNARTETGEMVVIDELKAMEYTIVGTYHFEPTQKMIDQEKKMAEKHQYEADLSFSHYKNVFIMPIKNAEELVKSAEDNGADSSQMVYVGNTIYIKDLSSMSLFKTEAQKVTGFDITVNVDYMSADSENDLEALESIITARYTIQRVFTMLVVVVITMLLIIAIMLVRGRRKEIGILVALGERRKNIYFQMVFEQLIIMIISTLIAFPAASLVLQKVASEYANVQLPFVIMSLFSSLLAGLVIVLVSTLVPAIYTMRVNPKKILL